MLSTSDSAVVLSSERTDDWLNHELRYLWDSYFPDIPIANQVDIAFDRAWKSRLGLIRLSECGSHSYIGINRLLRFHEVPNSVVSVTIAHELVHYSHGFGSPLPRKYRHPHYGDIVNQELTSRGLTAELRDFTEWTNNHWYGFYFAAVPRKKNGYGNNGHRRE